jgi:hypothetical protein
MIKKQNSTAWITLPIPQGKGTKITKSMTLQPETQHHDREEFGKKREENRERHGEEKRREETILDVRPSRIMPNVLPVSRFKTRIPTERGGNEI